MSVISFSLSEQRKAGQETRKWRLTCLQQSRLEEVRNRVLCDKGWRWASRHKTAFEVRGARMQDKKTAGNPKRGCRLMFPRRPLSADADRRTAAR